MGVLDDMVRQSNAMMVQSIIGNIMPQRPISAGFDTALPQDQEQAYRQWMQQIGHTSENGMAVTPDFTGQDYDYRGFFNKFGPVDISQGQHFTDEFKKPNHDTFSMESKYSRPGMLGGVWQGENFTPSSYNLMVKAARGRK